MISSVHAVSGFFLVLLLLLGSLGFDFGLGSGEVLGFGSGEVLVRGRRFGGSIDLGDGAAWCGAVWVRCGCGVAVE